MPEPVCFVSRSDARAVGLKRFFSGTPCIHGHVSERLVSGGQCMVCHVALRARSYERRKKAGKVAEYHRKYRARNPEKARAACKRWRGANPEASKAGMAAWERNNRAWRSRWRTGRKDKERERSKRFYKNNPKWAVEKAARQRARRLMATPQWVDRAELRRIYRDCPEGSHVDHIVPLRSPIVCGLHVPCNLQYLPASENIAKGNALVV